MKHTKFTRRISLALALLLMAAALPFGALAAETDFVELVATDITLDQTHFEYTGEEIRPNVTVRVNDTLLTLDKDYLLEYKNNIDVGEAAVVVTGIATSGYMGTVEHPFYIEPKTEDAPTLIPIKGTDVTIDGTSFPATGEEIKPAITVTVDGKILTAGEEYTLVYENNIQPGTASVTVTGVEDKGYTGTVIIHYTIEAAETQPEETQPEETQPEETEPEETKPQETQPEETKPVSYKITKGNGAAWYKDSEKTLSFTADGPFADFTGVSVDGKNLDKAHFEAKSGTVVLLKNAFLQTLKTGEHTIILHFGDIDAQGTFTVAAADENPKTGDSIFLWLSLLMVTGTCLAALKKKTA